jgi:hypothetical protein
LPSCSSRVRVGVRARARARARVEVRVRVRARVGVGVGVRVRVRGAVLLEHERRAAQRHRHGPVSMDARRQLLAHKIDT